MRKRFRRKRKLKVKKILLFLIVIFSIIYLLRIFFINFKLSSETKKFILNIISTSQYYSTAQNKTDNILKRLDNFFKNNVINKPLTILEYKFGYKEVNDDYGHFILKQDYTKTPLIYIYNSHQSESYSKEYLENYNIVPSVLMASYMLQEKLNNINISSIVEVNDITDHLRKNNLDYSKSYEVSRIYLTEIIKKYDSFRLFIDLHRDSAEKYVTTTEIDGKACAKVMFVVGLENPNYKENLNLTEKINNKIKEKYPTLTRGIMQKQGYGVNGVYNQDINSNVILLELGGNNNNIEEVNNTLNILANIIGEIINEKV